MTAALLRSRSRRLLGLDRGAGRAATLGLVLLAASVAGCADSPAAPSIPTWSADVAPILHRHCAECHRPGNVAPFPLVTYDDARRRARSVAEVVERGLMPPFLPERDYGRFRDARGLAPAEVGVLVEWARAGAPAGDLDAAPAPPVFREGFELGEPDLVAEMPVAFAVPAEGRDIYRNFAVPLPIAPGTRIRALELDPGNRGVVHHAAVLADATGTASRLEARDPEPGYEEMVGGTAPGGHFVGWTPGRGAIVLEPGMPWEVEEGTELVLQMHLVPTGRAEMVRARVALWLTDEPVEQRPASVHLLATNLDIAAGADSHAASDELELPVDVLAYAIYPHAHFLGRELKAWAERPDGTVEPLLWIKRWSFSWQDEYRYAEPLLLPAGSRLRLDLVYDNSSANASNPSAPPRRVVWGPSSSDEMGDVWLKVVPRREQERPRLEQAVRRHELDRFREGYAMRVALDPADVEARARLGIGYVQEGRHAEAVPHLEAALTGRDDAWDVNYNLGVALAVLGRHREAIARYQQALAADPGDARTHNALAGILLATGEVERALEHYRRAVELRPESPDLLSNLGLALARAGDAAAAERSYREALRLDPGHVLAHLGYGGLLSELGRDREAAGWFEAALAIEPDRFEAHVNLARSLARSGRLDDAERHLRRALELNPGAVGIHYLLGVTLAQAGRLEEAVTALEEAVRLEPGNSQAREDLARVRAIAPRPRG